MRIIIEPGAVIAEQVVACPNNAVEWITADPVTGSSMRLDKTIIFLTACFLNSSSYFRIISFYREFRARLNRPPHCHIAPCITAVFGFLELFRFRLFSFGDIVCSPFCECLNSILNCFGAALAFFPPYQRYQRTDSLLCQPPLQGRLRACPLTK